MGVLKELKWFFKQERKAYTIGVFFLLCVAFLELLPPKIIGYVVDELTTGGLSKQQLGMIIVALIGIALTLYVCRYIWRNMIFGASVKLGRILRSRMYKHFTKMDTKFYHKYRTGDLMAHATNDIQAVQQTAGSGVLTLVDALSIGSFVLITMFATISWKLTIISLLPMPLMAISTKIYGKLLHKRFLIAQEAFSQLNDKVQESMSGIKVIKAFGQEKEDIESFRLQSKDVVQKNMAVAKIDSLFDPTIAFVVGLSFILAVSFGSYFVVNKEMTVGDLVTFTTYLGLLVWPMLAFGFLFNIMERGRASYNRIMKIMAEDSSIESAENGLETVEGNSIAIKINKFTYRENTSFALRKIDVEIKDGETLAIVGRTGAGKTTLLRLLLREYDGYEGEIAIANHNIRALSLEALRKKIGYVPQEHFLFSTTVGENIAFGNKDATFVDIVAAAQTACIHEDILQFTNGYDTIVGERGVSLSGGQKQRISIARALLMKPDILILDDCLSAVDAKTEEKIVSALKEERVGKTTIITAHRLSSIVHADHIVVLDQGEVIQYGNHQSLMSMDGWYKEMYERQQLEDSVGGGESIG
ncbi:MAG: ABC transporter transmembrane domain-containing protein [Bacillaceae bacterium]